MRRLGLGDLPVICAPMAGGPSTPALVAAANAAGSLGFVPAGYRTAGQLDEDLDTVRALTPHFGVNLFVPDPRPDSRPGERSEILAYRDAIAAEVASLGAELGPLILADSDEFDAKIDLLTRNPVPWISFTFGLPDASVVDRLRRAGSRILCTVTDVAEALAAADLAPDGLVVQSSAAGGHRGTLDPYRTPDDAPLIDLVRAVTIAAGLPVVAAGGVSDAVGVRDVMAAGAEAVAVGTALLLADEAGTRPIHREAVADRAATTAVMRAFTGRPARGIANAFSRRYDPLAPAGYPAIHHLTAPMRRWAAEHGDRDHLHLWAGTGHAQARSGPTVDILQGLAP
jgi:NAD(P)H-dependent flavin oxidoreductase YrpB (nitropropane dioxygenase family)